MPITWIDLPVKAKPEEWSGAISIKQVGNKNIDTYKQLICNTYCKSEPHASIRCIDGRPAQTAAHGLGPQLAGGGPGLALAWAVVNKPSDNILSDMDRFAKTFHSGFALGGHRDDHSHNPSTGCGAIDRMGQIIARVIGLPDTVKPLVSSVMGDRFDEKIFTKVVEDFRLINVDKFLPQGYQNKLLKCCSSKDVEVVSGEHKEIAVVINTQKNTTFDKDSMCRQDENSAQAFNFDYWYIEELASSLESKQTEFITAVVAYQVGAAMVLTDGSLFLGVRQ
jgi:hypothetical protein